MKNRIHIYELEGYQKATQEKKDRMRVCKIRYFDLEGLPSEQIREILEIFIWDRGRILSPSSLASELIYFNNIRNFFIEKNIKELHYENQDKLLLILKGWMLEKGYALTSKKYRPAYDITADETSGIEKYMKKLLNFIKMDDARDEKDKDIWELKRFDFHLRINPIKDKKTLNFTKIPQADIRTEVKRAVFLQLKYLAMGSIASELTAINRFTKYLNKRYFQIKSFQDLEREHIENYLIYLQTEDKSRKNYRTDLYGLKRVIEVVGKIYEYHHLEELFINHDFPSTPRYAFKFYSDAEIKRLNAHIFNMDEQISRALLIHQMLGTRISDTLTLKTDCLDIREERYFIRIEQVKSVTYEKPISNELAQLVRKAIDYTKKHYGETDYIFVKKDDKTKPYQYSMIQNRIMVLIRQKNIRDDYGELLTFGTHIFRHCYGKKLSEMHVEDWMIARLLGHKTVQSVNHYRKIGNKMMADETRKSREKMDMILLDIIKGWDGYEI